MSRPLALVDCLPDQAAADPLSDNGNAEYFEREVDHRLAYDHTARQWCEFRGHHWYVDHVDHVVELAVDAMRQRGRDANLIPDPDFRKRALTHALKSEERRRIMDLLALAQSKPTIRVDGANWDANPLLIGVQNGVLELDPVRFRGGLTYDYITKVSPVAYDPSARCPRFERFMREVFADDLELVDYLQRCFGYCLTGLTVEQIFWILFGLGSNGKSTLIEVLQGVIFGPYHGRMPKIPMLQERNVRSGFFDDEMFAAVLAKLPADVRPVVRFAYVSGWRVQSEILPLEWRHVDREKAEVRLDPGTTKNQAGRVFPFTDDLRVLFDELWKGHQARVKAGTIGVSVFTRGGRPIKSLRGAWAKACVAAGYPGRILHDLRRSAVRNMERKGLSRSVAMQLTGHKTESVYRRYAITSEADLREGVERLNSATGTNRGDKRPNANADAKPQSA